jgi:hypothetical protein
VSRFQFVADHQSTYSVKWLCQVIGIARLSFSKWLAGAEARAARLADDEALDGRGGDFRGQCDGRVVQRLPQARDPRRSARLARPGHRPPRGLRLDRPLLSATREN